MAKKRAQRRNDPDRTGEAPVAYDWMTEVPGVFARHSDKCPVRDGRTCTCGPRGYRASIRDRKTNLRVVSPKFDSLSSAQAWQREQTGGREEPSTEPDPGSMTDLVEEFLEAVEDGLVRTPAGLPYDAESYRVLRAGLSYAQPELGDLSVRRVERRDIQRLIDQLATAGLAPARLLDLVNALQAFFAWAIRSDILGASPIVEIDLPPVRPHRNTSDWNGTSVTGSYPTTPPPPNGWTSSPGPVAQQGSEHWQQTQPGPSASSTFSAGQLTHGPGTGTAPGYSFASTSDLFRPPPASTGGVDPSYDASMQERWLWWTVRVIVLMFILIALVLVAESV